MLDQLLPKGLAAAATSLSVEPFEVIRLCVAAGEGPPVGLRFSEAQLQQLRTYGGIESWWDGVELPEDENAKSARLRAAMRLMLDRGLIGDKSARMDNVWRGLPPADQALLQQALDILVEEGSLVSTNAPTGVQISIVSDAQSKIESLADGKGASSGISALLEG